jgi:hypothetical protein
MREALLEHLLRKPDLYLKEMVIYLWDEFEARVTKSSVSRTFTFCELVEEKSSCHSERAECGSA